MDRAAATYPGALAGYKLHIVESHQADKADTSGTAKAVAGSLAQLNASDFGVGDIEMVREPAEQASRMGVPESAIAGHAYHTYQLTSPDGTVALEFKHNVDGREVYCEGTVDAIEFLALQVQSKGKKHVWNMLDILGAGAMQ